MYFDFADESDSVESAFLNCPTECPESQDKPFDRFRSEYCDACPNKKGENDFKRKTEDEIYYRLGENKFKFDELLSTLYRVMSFQNLPPEKISVKTNQMLSVYKNEKFRREKQIEENRPKN